ncbi:REP-associated tyrosine transposase [Pseudomarimonas arenosa]|uniref:Transposase n=1 Tax=Pseudomarimonas arenosa TaxID=2774145 RepID=A0AAW3ZL95_9GAMM|nr:transposase [Pseudomarimonas arenosa]MBD8526738.1 transposase [Pseudomarimonas arenosa]
MPNYRRVWVPGGTYFFTVTLLERRRRLLVDEVDRLRWAFARTCARLPFAMVAIVVLPDHLHCVWRLPEADADNGARWQMIKSLFSRGIERDERRSARRTAKRERGIWQRRYWEHLIRDEGDLIRHVDYIHYNPVKHGYVSAVRDWPWSSFHRWVREGSLASDWGSRPLPDAFSQEFGERS